MLNQFSAKVTGGRIDNRVRDRVTGFIEFEDASTALFLDLKGNCMRDIAGCLLVFETTPSPQTSDYTPPSGTHTGFVGEMTASRRLVLPGPFSHESNCLYLEWFEQDGSRMALLKPDARCRITGPEWRMSEIEELEQKRRRWTSLRRQDPDQENRWFEMAGILGVAPPNLDESEWEGLLREAEEDVEQLIRLFDQSDVDPEWYGPLSRAVGWAQADPQANPGDPSSLPEPPLASQPALDRLAADATSLLSYMVARAPSHAPPSDPFNRMLSRIAQVSAVLETARESIDTMQDGDQMLLLAQVKRALAGIHSAAEFLNDQPTHQAFAPETHESLRDRLFSLRENALNTMEHLRRN